MANSTIRSIFYAGTKVVASSGTEEALVADPLLVDSVKVLALSDNTGDVKLGVVNGPTATYVYVVELPFVITAPAGKKIDLSLIKVQVADNGDGVSYIAVN